MGAPHALSAACRSATDGAVGKPAGGTRTCTFWNDEVELPLKKKKGVIASNTSEEGRGEMGRTKRDKSRTYRSTAAVRVHQ